MVDTMLACDLLHMATSSDYSVVAVVCCDTDLVPAFMLAAQLSSKPVILISPVPCWTDPYISMMASVGVTVINGGLDDE
jgi:hypothetical protein